MCPVVGRREKCVSVALLCPHLGECGAAEHAARELPRHFQAVYITQADRAEEARDAARRHRHAGALQAQDDVLLDIERVDKDACDRRGKSRRRGKSAAGESQRRRAVRVGVGVVATLYLVGRACRRAPPRGCRRAMSRC